MWKGRQTEKHNYRQHSYILVKCLWTHLRFVFYWRKCYINKFFFLFYLHFLFLEFYTYFSIAIITILHTSLTTRSTFHPLCICVALEHQSILIIHLHTLA